MAEEGFNSQIIGRVTGLVLHTIVWKTISVISWIGLKNLRVGLIREGRNGLAKIWVHRIWNWGGPRRLWVGLGKEKEPKGNPAGFWDPKAI